MAATMITENRLKASIDQTGELRIAFVLRGSTDVMLLLPLRGHPDLRGGLQPAAELGRRHQPDLHSR